MLRSYGVWSDRLRCIMNIKLLNRGTWQSLLILLLSLINGALKESELGDLNNSTLRPSNGRIWTRVVFRPCWILHLLGTDSSQAALLEYIGSPSACLSLVVQLIQNLVIRGRALQDSS